MTVLADTPCAGPTDVPTFTNSFPFEPTVRARFTLQLGAVVRYRTYQLQGTKSTNLRPLLCDRTAH